MIKRYRGQPLSLFLRIIVDLAAAITVFVLIAVVGYILVKGIVSIWNMTTAW